MKLSISILLIAMAFGNLFSQGQVNMNYNSEISSMMDRYISNNRQNEEIKGWRIQIITTDDRRKMESAMGKFRSLYPEVEVKWNHMPPYYRVKVGAYENKMQLMAFLLDLKRDFPGVIPVVENIRKSELIGY